MVVATNSKRFMSVQRFWTHSSHQQKRFQFFPGVRCSGIPRSNLYSLAITLA